MAKCHSIARIPARPPPPTHTLFLCYIPGHWPIVAEFSPRFPFLFYYCIFFNSLRGGALVQVPYPLSWTNYFFIRVCAAENCKSVPLLFSPLSFDIPAPPPPPSTLSSTTTEGHLWSEGLQFTCSYPWGYPTLEGGYRLLAGRSHFDRHQPGTGWVLKRVQRWASGTCGTSRSPARCHLPDNTHLCTGVRKGLAQRWFETYSHG